MPFFYFWELIVAIFDKIICQILVADAVDFYLTNIKMLCN